MGQYPINIFSEKEELTDVTIVRRCCSRKNSVMEMPDVSVNVVRTVTSTYQRFPKFQIRYFVFFVNQCIV
jgi:hypothetical protein